MQILTVLFAESNILLKMFGIVDFFAYLCIVVGRSKPLSCSRNAMRSPP
jgi:hypothetical protein